MAYQNGRLPDSALGTIPGTNHRIRAELVPQTAALRAAFRARFGRDMQITDSYRSYAQQVAVKKAKGFLAATPGTSNHGWGQAIDWASNLNNAKSAEHAWMRANGPRFGWTWPNWAQKGKPGFQKDEPWHWEATLVSGYGSAPVASAASTPAAAPVVPPKPRDPVEDEFAMDYLKAIYIQRLGRMPDPGGAAFWLDKVASGELTWKGVADAISGSAESKAFAALGSEAARNAKRAEALKGGF